MACGAPTTRTAQEPGFRHGHEFRGIDQIGGRLNDHGQPDLIGREEHGWPEVTSYAGWVISGEDGHGDDDWCSGQERRVLASGGGTG